MSLKVLAEQIAREGRFGDNVLVHMNRHEVAGLAALAPGGKLPINPKTGLPEAFFFLPFLAGLGAAAAPAAAAAATLPAAAAAAPAMGALGAGISAGLSAASTAIPAAAGAAIPAASTIASALPAAAAPVASAVAPSLAVLPGEAAAAAVPSLAVLPGEAAGISTLAGQSFFPPSLASMTSAPVASTSVAAPASVAPSSGIAGLGGIGSDYAATASTAGVPAALVDAGAATGAAAATPAATQGGLGGLMGALKGIDPSMMLMGASMLQGLGGGGGGEEDDGGDKKLSDNAYYEQGGTDPVFPGSDYRGGIDPEFNYFPKIGRNSGGLVKGYAGGGLASLAPPPGMQGMPAAPGAMPQGTGQMTPDPQAIPESPYPKEQVGSTSGTDKELITQTVQAIKGRHPNPNAVIIQFIQTFGEQALRDLVARVKGGGQQMSDGMSDSVPAMIGGQQPAALSEGEFIVPADVVSGLGNGSTDAGANQLKGMMDRVRTMRGGGPVQPPAINARGAMPV